MAKEMNVKKRLTGETPPFFKKVRITCLVIGGLATTIGTSLLAYDNLKAQKIGGILLAVGGTILAVGTFISQLTLDEKTK